MTDLLDLVALLGVLLIVVAAFLTDWRLGVASTGAALVLASVVVARGVPGPGGES